ARILSNSSRRWRVCTVGRSRGPPPPRSRARACGACSWRPAARRPPPRTRALRMRPRRTSRWRRRNCASCSRRRSDPRRICRRRPQSRSHWCAACRPWPRGSMEVDRMPKPLSELAREVRAGLGRAIVGQGDALDTLFLTIVCGGHALLEGVPGLGKTLAVRSLAGLLRVAFPHAECTRDLMPADITGSTVLNTNTSEFRFHQGPLFTDLLLVDEINRMPPRTQAALLEAMEERQVTVDGTPYPLSSLFTVIATQNPV